MLKRNFQILAPLDFLAEFTRHIPPKAAELQPGVRARRPISTNWLRRGWVHGRTHALGSLHAHPLRCLTGRYPSRIGQFGVLGTWSEPIIPVSRPTVASVLRQQGYATACVGKWHLGLGWGGEEQRGPPPVGADFPNGPTDSASITSADSHIPDIGTVLEQDRVIAVVEKEENHR